MIGTFIDRASVTSLPSAPAPEGSTSRSSIRTVVSFCIFARISRPRRPRSRFEPSDESAKCCSSSRMNRGTTSVPRRKPLLPETVALALTDIGNERAKIVALDRARCRTGKTEKHRAEDRREPPYVVGKEREREREEQPERETARRAERPADQGTCGHRADATSAEPRGPDRDVGS